MYSKSEKYDVIISSTTDINMSNWQITKTVDTLTMVNNKFVILSMINEMIQKGIEKKDIFITDKSFLITTNYKTYFEKSNEFNGMSSEVVKMYSLGRFISMQYNEAIVGINCLFDFYKGLNSITNKHLKCRIRSRYLSDSFNKLFQKGIDEAYEVLLYGVKEQIVDTYEKFLVPDLKKRDEIINSLELQKEKHKEKNKTKYERLANDSAKFAYTFNRFDRPIIGVYNDKLHSIKIINSDQMYKNGEESATQIKLNRITKNSPVVIALVVTGPMLGFLGYLLWRDHKVTNEMVENDMLDIPQSNDEVVENILGNSDGALFNMGELQSTDSQIKDLAKHNLNKLEVVTNRRIVHLEMNKLSDKK